MTLSASSISEEWMLKITFSSTFSLIPLQTSSLQLHEGHRLKLTI
jgi:hypothetical protein